MHFVISGTWDRPIHPSDVAFIFAASAVQDGDTVTLSCSTMPFSCRGWSRIQARAGRPTQRYEEAVLHPNVILWPAALRRCSGLAHSSLDQRVKLGGNE